MTQAFEQLAFRCLGEQRRIRIAFCDVGTIGMVLNEERFAHLVVGEALDWFVLLQKLFRVIRRAVLFVVQQKFPCGRLFHFHASILQLKDVFRFRRRKRDQSAVSSPSR
ncbi:hypothetical protein SDC9_94047 [bioreactor metagenome]|uniref:Uncharacterized protein n=1 Tax=bioreactor metagenome TaxID=1076179 RepID=A0A645A3Q0_9ZZZZ